MILEGAYKFEDNWSVEIVNPTLEIVGLAQGNPNIPNIDFTTKKYSVQIILKTESMNFGLILDEVQSVSLNWEDGSNHLPTQVAERLNDFKV